MADRRDIAVAELLERHRATMALAGRTLDEAGRRSVDRRV
jgi:hypothetical protein